MSQDVSEACMLLWSDDKTVSSVLFSLDVQISTILDVVKRKKKKQFPCASEYLSVRRGSFLTPHRNLSQRYFFIIFNYYFII